MPSHIGIDLDGLLPKLVVDDGQTSRMQVTDLGGNVPPTIVLGRVYGEDAGIDLAMPVDSRGSGLAVPGGHVFGHDAAAPARLPVAYAWEQLLAVTEGSKGPLWRWQLDADNDDAISPGQAIAAGLSGLLEARRAKSLADDEDRPTQTLVVPNSLEESQQDHLLRSLRPTVGNTRLLWRPIAAALAWIRRHREELTAPTLQHHGSIGRLLHLHLGIDAWEATVMEVVPHMRDNTTWILPGRLLPGEASGDALRGWPRRALEHAARAATTNGHRPSDSRLWNLLWATPWAHAMLLSDAAGQRAANQLPPWVAAESSRLGRDTLLGILHALDDTALQPWDALESRLGAHPDSRSARQWIATLFASLRGTRFVGAIVTGPMARLSAESGTSIGQQLLQRVCQAPVDRTLIEGTTAANTALLAEGAALYGRRASRGEPTYLDTLPSVHMIAMLQGEPEWINLLETDEPWVMGSETWSKMPEKTRFGIQRGERDLTVVVHRGGSATCRRVSAEFESPAAQSSPVSLHVSITPGQGAPRVEVIPDDREIFRGRTLLLDWDKAEDTHRSSAAELASVERICPPHEPRMASYAKWASRSFHILRDRQICGIRGVVQHFVTHPSRDLERRDGQSEEPLAYLNQLLREWDARTNDGWATAVSSDCTLNTGLDSDHQLLGSLVEQLDSQLGRTRQPEVQRVILRIMGILSARAPHLDAMLEGFLQGRYPPGYLDLPGLWWAAGHCLRTPEEVRALLVHATRFGPNDHVIKSLARALMFRRDALASCKPELTSRVLEMAVRVARQRAQSGSFRIQFREAALLCTYLLRQRAYDPDYAGPGTPEYESLEATFQLARRQMNRHHVMGGVFNMVELVDTILNYIRRRGRGRLVALAIDNSPN